MCGRNDSVNERWMDISGNIYSSDFIRRFSYVGTTGGPVVRITYQPTGTVFRGRIEGSGLKPNFAYQLKLRGDYAADPEAFEKIGRAGRWRLPGRATNYSDADYELYPDKARVEAYLFFDYFVTDAEGRAVYDFECNSTLHVVFNAWYQGLPTLWDAGIRRFVVDASNPRIYARPKGRPATEYLWAQAEAAPGRSPVGQVRLPPGRYAAILALTEESFHWYGDGGWWATVMEAPVRFVIE